MKNRFLSLIKYFLAGVFVGILTLYACVSFNLLSIESFRFDFLPKKSEYYIWLIVQAVGIIFQLLFCWKMFLFVTSFIVKTWYKKYQEVYAKHISFQHIEEGLLEKPFTTKSFFISLFLIVIIFVLIDSPPDPIQGQQLIRGILLGYCYPLLDFLAGIIFFSWLKKHPDGIIGKTTFDKKVTKAINVANLSKLLILISILALCIQSFYLYGFLCYLLVDYIRLLVFNRLPLRIE
jgi:hypothetical protein